MSRRKAFSVIAVVLSLITLSAAASWCTLSEEFTFDFAGLDEPYYIDGVDISSDIMVSRVAYLILGFAALSSVFAVVTALTAVAWSIFGLNAVKRFSVISVDELKFTPKFFLISSAVTLVTAVIIITIRAVTLKSGVPFFALLYCWQNPLFMWLLYIRRLRVCSH